VRNASDLLLFLGSFFGSSGRGLALRVQGKRRTLVPGRAGEVRRFLWGLGAPKPLPDRSGVLFDWSFTAGLCAAVSPAGPVLPRQRSCWGGWRELCSPVRPLAAARGCRLLRRFFLLRRPRNIISGRSCVKARPRSARCYAALTPARSDWLRGVRRKKPQMPQQPAASRPGDAEHNV
jgi:hypothetical protein